MWISWSVQCDWAGSNTGLALARSWPTVDIYDRLVPVDLAVTDLQVEVAFRVCADPGLVVHRGTLAAKI